MTMDCEAGAPLGLKLTLASASFSRNETESTLTSIAPTSTFLAMSLMTPSFTASGVSMFFAQPARHSAARQMRADFTYRLYPLPACMIEKRPRMTDAQMMTLALAIIIPLSLLLYSNSRISDAKETLRADIAISNNRI